MIEQDETKKLKGFQAFPENINRKGRPRKGLTLTDIAREILEEVLPSGVTRKEVLMRKVATLAYEGNETFIKLIWNYVDGMPTQKTELTGVDGSPVEFLINRDEIKEFEEFRELNRKKELLEDKSNKKDL